MINFPMWRRDLRTYGVRATALGLILATAACTPTGDFIVGSRDAAAAGPTPIGATRLLERDVEAPEIFDVSTEGLWDGRPSLGGVWVAHPDATSPERVIVRNLETGSFVIGALFRRERENPGPEIQVSSDAAAALDILAGAPTNMQVIALRREEVADTEAPVADVAAPIVPPEADVSPGAEALPAIAATSLDASTGAETVETASRPLLRPIGSPATHTVAELPRNMSAEDVLAGITQASFSPSTLGARRDITDIAATADAAITETEVAVAAPVAAPIEATPLQDTPIVSAAVTPTPEPVATLGREPAATALDRPFVQIGIFSVQENANNTGQTLRNAGLVPTIYDQTSNGRQFWRVVVGPAPSTEDRAAVLETVRGLGFEDAYFVTR